MFETAIVILLITAIAIVMFGIDVHAGEPKQVRELTPRLQLTNPSSIISGQCMTSSDCVYSSLVCLGNVCVVAPDAPLEHRCNETHKCYNALVGLSSIGVVTNECVPLLAQHWDADNCNVQNKFSCLGEYTTENGKTVCKPAGSGAVVSYTSYGGRNKLMTTLPSLSVAQLFVDANPQVLTIDNVVE